jgi:hypothetical protein
MANYKVVDADQLDTDLASVADAIRAKAGTTGKMAFPADFKSVVDGIQTGGSGELVLPDNARLYYVGMAESTLNANVLRIETTATAVLTE